MGFSVINISRAPTYKCYNILPLSAQCAENQNLHCNHYKRGSFILW